MNANSDLDWAVVGSGNVCHVYYISSLGIRPLKDVENFKKSGQVGFPWTICDDIWSQVGTLDIRFSSNFWEK